MKHDAEDGHPLVIDRLALEELRQTPPRDALDVRIASELAPEAIAAADA